MLPAQKLELFLRDLLVYSLYNGVNKKQFLQLVTICQRGSLSKQSVHQQLFFSSLHPLSICLMVARFKLCQEIDKRRSFVRRGLSKLQKDVIKFENECEDDFGAGSVTLWSPLDMV